MQIPTQIKPAALGAVVGAIILAVVGFGWGGWKTQSAANQMANQAILAVLTPICVQNFSHQAGATEKLAEFMKTSTWQRDEFISKGGWATIPGQEAPRIGAARACADALSASKT
ncbi:conserved hypothetical protein [Hyphomicrobiales bacterium]|nr:conserved hypothetical protein [Hyphomicrobiales bacterium]CAH1664822.1 conserved hypothetical protein [Hyphomicrobiales bacterium]